MGEQGDPNDFGRRYHTCSVGTGRWKGKPARLFTDHSSKAAAEAVLPILVEKYPDVGSIEVWDTLDGVWVTGDLATGVR
jgi:hypothetical protein